MILELQVMPTMQLHILVLMIYPARLGNWNQRQVNFFVGLPLTIWKLIQANVVFC